MAVKFFRIALALVLGLLVCAIIVGNSSNDPVRGLYTQIEINAPADRVWHVLTDFNAYPQWNPFLRIRGDARPNSRLTVLAGSGGLRFPFWPKVVVAEPNRELQWVGHAFVPGLFDGEHTFEIEPMPTGGVRVIQRERFKGSLVNLFWNRISASTSRGFRDMNQALKVRCEQR